MFWIEQYFFSDGPPNIQYIPSLDICICINKSQLSKKDDVNITLVEAFPIESLTFIQVHYGAVV